MDGNGDGELDADELMEAMDEIGQFVLGGDRGGDRRVTKREIEEFIREFDTDRSGTLSFNEFMRMVSVRMALKLQEGFTGTADVEVALAGMQVFKLILAAYDRDGDGKLDAAEMARMIPLLVKAGRAAAALEGDTCLPVLSGVTKDVAEHAARVAIKEMDFDGDGYLGLGDLLLGAFFLSQFLEEEMRADKRRRRGW